MNGTGAFALDHWTPGQEIVLTKNPTYWGTPAKLDRVVVQIIPEWGTRFAELQAGDADVVDVDVANRSQADALVGEDCVFDLATSTYKPCTVVDATKPLSRHIGQTALSMDVIIYNFAIH
jgi:ABC-type transport system substrate-binding protein